MKYALALACLLIFVSLPLIAAESGLNETGTAWVKAFKANDLDAVVALYAPDAELFPPDAMQAKGKEAIRANYAGVFQNMTIQDVSVIEAEHETHGDISLSWGLFRVTMVPKAGGNPITMEGRFSDVSKRIGGKWMYVVDHASVAPPAQTMDAH
jgi:uncharacterized protein (TIGR02246 family)